MGSVLEKSNTGVAKTKRRSIRPKGDRLGWTPRNQVVCKPLHEIACTGEIVNSSCCFVSVASKMIR